MEHKPYSRPKDRFWFLRHPAYKKYVLREATSVFIGLWMLNILLGVLRLSQGEVAWNQWLGWQSSGVMTVFSVITFLMAMLHTYTWFAIAPKAMPKYIAGKKVEHQLIVLVHWVGFVFVSIVFISFVGWGA